MEIIPGHNSRAWPIAENQKSCFSNSRKIVGNFMTVYSESTRVIWVEAGLRISSGKGRDGTEIEITRNIPVSQEREAYWEGRRHLSAPIPLEGRVRWRLTTFLNFRSLRSVLDGEHFWCLSAMFIPVFFFFTLQGRHTIFLKCYLSCYFKIS